MLADTVKPDIICGTESWLNSSINNNEIFPDNFTAYRKDRESSQNGGGVFQAAKMDLTTSCSELNSECEILWTETRIKGCRPLLVGVFYRPPNDKGDAIDHLGESLTRLGEKINSHNVILTGDFNLPNILWNDHTIRNGINTRVANKLISLVEELGLSPRCAHCL